MGREGGNRVGRWVGRGEKGGAMGREGGIGWGDGSGGGNRVGR